MKTILKITGFAGLCFLMACQPRVKNITIHINPLKASELYNPYAVYNYMQVYKDSNKTLAEQYFTKGKDYYYKNPEQATYFYKRSLSLWPDYRHYIELAELLSFQKSYAEMNELYRMLMFKYQYNGIKNTQYLFQKPSLEDVEQYVASNILVYNTVWNTLGEQLALTDSVGYKMEDIKKFIMQDARISLSEPTEENKNVLWGFLTKDEKMQYFKHQMEPDYYAQHIDDTATIFDIDENSVRQFAYQSIDGPGLNNNDKIFYAYDDFMDEVDKDRQHNFERHYTMNDSIDVMIYAVDSSGEACPKDMRCIYHRLVTFVYGTARTPNHIIASKVVAIQSGEKLSTVKFNHNHFTITNYKCTWEKPFDRFDFDNHLKNVEQTGQESFVITPRGKIKQVSSPAGDKASS